MKFLKIKSILLFCLCTLNCVHAESAKWWFGYNTNVAGDWFSGSTFLGVDAKYGSDERGTYLILDGIDDRIQTDVFESPTEAFSISLFVKNETEQWSSTSCLLNKYNAFRIRTHKDSTKISCGVFKNGTWKDYYYEMLISITEWRHYVVTFDSITGNLKLFVDGQLAKQVYEPEPIDGGHSSLDIGSDSYGLTYYKGSIDDIRIYSYALSNETVQSVTRMPNEPTYSWRLKDNLNDDSGNFHLMSIGEISFVETYKGSVVNLHDDAHLESENDFSMPNEDFFVSCYAKFDSEKFPHYTTILEKVGQFRIDGLGGTKTLRFSVYIENDGYHSITHTLGDFEHLDSLNQIGGVFDEKTKMLYLYFNGRIVASKALAADKVRSYNGKLIAGMGMNGLISHIEIYSYIPSEDTIGKLGNLDVITKLNFESDFNDASHNLAYHALGTPNFIGDTQGTCISLNGLNDALISNSFLQDQNGFSISCIAKSNDFYWNSNSAFAGKDQVYYLGVVKDTKKIRFSVKSNEGNWKSVYYLPLDDISQWHHYAGVYSPESKTISLFYDGKLVSETSFQETLKNQLTSELSIGKLNQNYLSAQIDDLVIFSYPEKDFSHIDPFTLNIRIEMNVEGLNPLNYQLSFRDEFNGTGLDSSKWKHPFSLYRDNYMDENDVTVSNGIVRLPVIYRDDKLYGSYIQTRDLFQQQYGYFEARVKTHRQQGMHSCFWSQSPTYGQITNDLTYSGAEIDIIEYFGMGRSDGGLAQNIYYNSGSDLTGYAYKILKVDSGATVDRSIVPYEEFNVYGVNWSPYGYQFYVNGKKSIFIPAGVSKRDQYLVLSVYSSSWERPRLNLDLLPDAMEVDYVRVYKWKPLD